MVNQEQAVQALAAWAQSVDASHAQLMAQAAPAAAQEQTWLEWLGEGAEDVVNGAASLGYAAIQNPEATLAVVGGAALAVGGYALATGGVVVSATGVGAIAGVPAVGAGVGMMGVGALGVAAGGQQLLDAASQNPVEPMQVNWGNEKKTKDTNEKIDKHQADSSGSHSRQQKDITQDPSHATPLFRQKAEEAEKKSRWWG